MPLYTAMDMKYCLSEWMKDAFTSTFFFVGFKGQSMWSVKGRKLSRNDRIWHAQVGHPFQAPQMRYKCKYVYINDDLFFKVLYRLYPAILLQIKNMLIGLAFLQIGTKLSQESYVLTILTEISLV